MYPEEIDTMCPNDICWNTGYYTPECECEFCEYKHECSGYTGDKDDD